jgi:uncharacterized protein YllA (UPF0747 family)
MNTEAERKKSYGSHIPEEFQRRYANVIIDLEHLNRDLQDYLTSVQNYCQEVSSRELSHHPLCAFIAKYITHHHKGKSGHEITVPPLFSLLVN